MINWNTAKKGVIPESGREIILELPDAKVCRGIVNESGGFTIVHQDYVDLDVAGHIIPNDQKWVYLNDFEDVFK